VMYAGKVMEEGDVFSIFNGSKHPYTIGLIESVAYRDQPGGMISSIEGSVPSLVNPPAGCRFHPRCGYAMAICKDVQPELRNVANGHQVACHLIQK